MATCDFSKVMKNLSWTLEAVVKSEKWKKEKRGLWVCVSEVYGYHVDVGYVYY